MRQKLTLICCVIASALLAACSPDSKTTPLTSPSPDVRAASTPAPFKSPTPTSLPPASVTTIPTPSTRPGSEARLHVNNVKRVPVATTSDDFYDLVEAVDGNDDAKALRMIQQGKATMVENDSPIIVLESGAYVSRVKVKKSGRIGWVKTSWIF